MSTDATPFETLEPAVFKFQVGNLETVYPDDLRRIADECEADKNKSAASYLRSLAVMLERLAVTVQQTAFSPRPAGATSEPLKEFDTILQRSVAHVSHSAGRPEFHDEYIVTGADCSKLRALFLAASRRSDSGGSELRVEDVGNELYRREAYHLNEAEIAAVLGAARAVARRAAPPNTETK